MRCLSLAAWLYFKYVLLIAATVTASNIEQAMQPYPQQRWRWPPKYYTSPRKINWRPFRPTNVLHIHRVVSVVLWVYDEKGKLYKADLLDPDEVRPMMFWADVTLFHNKDTSEGCMRNLEFGFKEDAYVFGWPGKRLSSLKEHEYYWRHKTWLTIADRDFVFGAFTEGMFD